MTNYLPEHNYVQVRFENNYRAYEFMNELPDIQEGDTVVVNTQYGLTLGKVEAVTTEPTTTKNVTKWTISKVDTSRHDARVLSEKRIKEVKAAINTRKKELEKTRLIELLAKEDEGMAELVNELKLLGGTL